MKWRMVVVAASASLLASACTGQTAAPTHPTPTEVPPAAGPSNPDGAGGAVSAAPGHGDCLPLGGTFDPATATFIADFTADPAAPKPACPSSAWDIQLHFRDQSAWLAPHPFDAHHGPGCDSPNDPHAGHHRVTENADLVFFCRDHVMTAIDGGEYGMIYLTPAAMVDFSDGEATITFDMSTFRSSNRDWIDLWITPFDENLALPLDEEFPDAQGNPMNAIHIRMDGSGSDAPLDGAFRLMVIRDGRVEDHTNTWNPYNTFLETDRARRDTFELKVSRTSVELSMPGYSQPLQFGTFKDLGWSTGVVQFGHHSYNPRKDGGVPNTWHWDNVSIAPAVPFTIVPLTEEYTGEASARMALPEPAGDGTFLRFTAQGRVHLSFDGGQFSVVSPRASSLQHRPETFSSYMVPVPKGTTRVDIQLDADDWLPPPYFARGFALWSDSAPAN